MYAILVAEKQPGHGVQELFELRRVGVELFENTLLAVLDLVLRPTGAERFGQVVPELEKPGVEHFEDAAHVLRTVPIEI